MKSLTKHKITLYVEKNNPNDNNVVLISISEISRDSYSGEYLNTLEHEHELFNSKSLILESDFCGGIGFPSTDEVVDSFMEYHYHDISSFIDNITADTFVVVSDSHYCSPGISVIFASICQSCSIDTIFILTPPFKFEGRKRLKMFDSCIESIQLLSSQVYSLNSEKIFLEQNTTVNEAISIKDRFVLNITYNLFMKKKYEELRNVEEPISFKELIVQYGPPEVVTSAFDELEQIEDVDDINNILIQTDCDSNYYETNSFDDGYRLGLVDSQGVATGLGWDESSDTSDTYEYTNANHIQKIYKETTDTLYRYLKVMLTPASFLNFEQRDTRNELYKEYDHEIVLELVHDRGNKYDKNALEVYYGQIYIGHVRKKFKDENIDNTRIIDDFCFENNRLKNIDIVWNGDSFVLSQKTEQALKEEYRQNKIYEEKRQIEEEKQREEDELSAWREREKKERISFYKALLGSWKWDRHDVSMLSFSSSARDDNFHLESHVEYSQTTLIGNMDLKSYKIKKPGLMDDFRASRNNGDYGDKDLNYRQSMISALEYNISYLESQSYGEYDKSGLKTPRG